MHDSIPVLFGGVGTTFKIGESCFIGVDVPTSGAALDAHVADGHTFLAGKIVKHATAIFVGVTKATVDAEKADNVQDDILGIDTQWEPSADVDAANLETRHGERLCGKHVSHLAGTDAKGDGSERTVRGRVRVAARDGTTGLRDALFGADNVDNALAACGDIEKFDVICGTVFAQFGDHGLCHGIGERFVLVECRYDVVNRGKGTVGVPHFEAEIAQHAKRLRAGDFVDEVCPDEELCLPAGQLPDGVRVPNFFEECLGHVEKEKMLHIGQQEA